MDKQKPTMDVSNAVRASSLGLGIPDQSPPPANSMLLEPRDTSEWIEALPLANIGETSRQIYTSLLDFNRYEIPELVRTKVVELFRPTVHYVCDNLRRHYMDMGFPLSAKAWKTVTLSRELYNELAINYKIIVERMLGGQTERFDRKLLVIALHRALYYLGQVFLQSSLAYTNTPTRLWKEINAIFAFSRQNHVHRIPVKNRIEEHEEVSTIEETYKALLLFAAAAPGRLRQSHLQTTFDKALQWAPQTRFLGMDDDIPSTGCLNINLVKDEAPVHNALHMPIPGRHIAILDLRDLIRKLHDEYEETPSAGDQDVKLSQQQISRALLRQLIRNWHSPPERKFVRTRLHFSLHILCGLRAIHAALNPLGTEETTRPQAISDEPHSSLSTGPNVNMPTLPTQHSNPLDAIDQNSLSLSPLPSNERSDSLLIESQGQFGNSHLNDEPVSQWRDSSLLDLQRGEGMEITTLNESAGGYCLQWPTDRHPPKVKIGELLGIGGDSGQPDYGLGVIRWIHCDNQARMELGLQVIATQVEAGTAYLASANGRVPPRNRRDPINCLLAHSGQDATGQGCPTLILANANYSLGTRLWLWGASKSHHLIRLTRLIDFSSAYARFAYEYVNHEGDMGSEPDGDYNEFESLWNAL